MSLTKKSNLTKFAKIILVLIAIILLAGCNDKENTTTNNNSNSNTNSNTTSEKVTSKAQTEPIEISESDIAGMEKLNCSREGSAGSNTEVNLNYELYYQGDYLQILHSTEQIITEDENTLDEYENAYHSIYLNYQDLDYYDTAIIRTSNSVTNDTVINYSKIDTDKLLEIEGEEDNVIKDGKVKLQDWLDFAEQFGTTCEE